MVSCHNPYWLISLSASLKLKPKVSLAVKEKVSVNTLYWLCSRNFNNLHKFGQSFSHNYSRSTELPANQRGIPPGVGHIKSIFWRLSCWQSKGRRACVFTEIHSISLRVLVVSPTFICVLFVSHEKKRNNRVVLLWIHPLYTFHFYYYDNQNISVNAARAMMTAHI